MPHKSTTSARRSTARDLISRSEIRILFLIATCAGLLWLFMAIADEMREGNTQHLDERIILALRSAGDPADPVGPRWLEVEVRDFSALGGTSVLVLITTAVGVYLSLLRRWRTVVLVVVAIAGGLAISSLLKLGFGRPRPDLVPHGSYVSSASFPSGHSMMSAVTYLTLAALLARTQERRRMKLFLLGFAAVLTVLVGFSRVYLGVHWPTDVLAGWTLGAAWAILWWLAARWLQLLGSVEPPSNGASEPPPAR